jgi:hypothetical protein
LNLQQQNHLYLQRRAAFSFPLCLLRLWSCGSRNGGKEEKYN